jgi:uncharacterized membrane protein YphA (DoxX/SURF4 family)
MKRTIYWTTTGILALGLFGGGAVELTHYQPAIAGMARLGYPAYFLTIIAAWKVLGALALLAPGFPRLKEWAYAGVFFNMTGAAISHAVCHTPAWNIAVTLGFAALAVASWALRPESRKLGVLFSAKTRESEGM